MNYTLYRKILTSQYIHVRLTIKCSENEKVYLQLPAWRPGRYELANYSQNIRNFHIKLNSLPVPFQKQTKDLWSFLAIEEAEYTITYEYYARQMDAGGSWSDPYQLYINFINLAFELKGREDEAISVKLELPDDYKIATSLPLKDNCSFEAKNFQQLVDSPLIASPSLQHESYKIGQTEFHLWFQGKLFFEVPEIISHFEKFTRKQIAAFGEFPASNFHFLFQLLPYKHYHGVEHKNSTVITYGPDENQSVADSLDQLLGVSSHELYHFWNVCRIRPKELFPYNFSKEAYFESGVVAEGVTTYMGDLFLLKSGYYSLPNYLEKLEKMINKEFESLGWQNQSITESSWDLWLDGYKAGIPEKKVSIYNRGALISFCLDMLLLDKGNSLQKVMKRMWNQFGKTQTGYLLGDFEQMVAEYLEDEGAAKAFFNSYVYGKEDLFPIISSGLKSIGIHLETTRRDNNLESDFGFILNSDQSIIKIHPQSPAYSTLMLGDFIRIIKYNKSGVKLSIKRDERELDCYLPYSPCTFYRKYSLKIGLDNQKRIAWMG